MKNIAALFSIFLGCLVLTSCSTLQDKTPLAMLPIEPDQNELLVAEHALLIVDGSSSMLQANKFPVARATAEAIVGAMPSGTYNFGLIEFGGHDDVVFPLEPFLRISAASQTRSLQPLGGITPLGDAFETAATLLSGTDGRIVVILITDGQPTNASSTRTAAEALASAHDDICFVTIRIGDVAGAGDLLGSIAALSDCGQSFRAAQLDDPAMMKTMIRSAFFAWAPDRDGDGVFDADDQCPGTPTGAVVDERGCWVIPGVLFPYNEATIKPQYFNELDAVARVIKANPGLRFHIDGHTDAIGSQAFNLTLSKRRAEAVAGYLTTTAEVDAERLVTRGFGKARPIAPNITTENRTLNRRVELSVIE